MFVVCGLCVAAAADACGDSRMKSCCSGVGGAHVGAVAAWWWRRQPTAAATFMNSFIFYFVFHAYVDEAWKLALSTPWVFGVNAEKSSLRNLLDKLGPKIVDLKRIGILKCFCQDIQSRQI